MAPRFIAEAVSHATGNYTSDKNLKKIGSEFQKAIEDMRISNKISETS